MEAWSEQRGGWDVPPHPTPVWYGPMLLVSAGDLLPSKAAVQPPSFTDGKLRLHEVTCHGPEVLSQSSVMGGRGRVRGGALTSGWGQRQLAVGGGM